MIRRSSHTGRRRAFDKLARLLGPGVVLEGLRLDGKQPLALWSILKPRVAVTVDAPPESGLAQDCVTVDYILAGIMPDAPNGGIATGSWSLEVPDHALGRCIQRSGLLPSAIIAEAHHNLLGLRVAIVMLGNKLDSGRRFLIKAGPGGFVCHLHVGRDRSSGRIDVMAHADTWVADDMLRDDQTLLADDGEPGERLGDFWLLPAPLRRIVKDGLETISLTKLGAEL
jgi:hypothetical protein